MTPNTVVIVDLDRDGAPDLVTTNVGGSSITVFRGSCR